MLTAGRVAQEFARQSWMVAISNLNTYNFIFLMLGPLLRGTPKPFLVAVGKSAPATAGVLVQFPLYGAIAATLIGVKGA